MEDVPNEAFSKLIDGTRLHVFDSYQKRWGVPIPKGMASKSVSQGSRRLYTLRADFLCAGLKIRRKDTTDDIAEDSSENNRVISGLVKLLRVVTALPKG